MQMGDTFKVPVPSGMVFMQIFVKSDGSYCGFSKQAYKFRGAQPRAAGIARNPVDLFIPTQ